jgi:hypothetical protein
MKKRQPRRGSYKRFELLLGRGDLAVLDAYARARNVSRAVAILTLVHRSLHEDAVEELDGLWRQSRAERQLEGARELVESLHAFEARVAPSVFAAERLLAYGMAQGGTLQVPEDELLAEARACARGEVEQALAECSRPEDATAEGPPASESEE